MRKSPAVLTLTLLSAVVVGACGSGARSGIGTAGSTASTTTPCDFSSCPAASSVTTTPTQAFTPVDTWTFALKDPDSADSAAGSVALGRFGPASAAPSFDPTESVTTGPCTVDQERDLVAPFEFQMRNTDQQLTQEVKASLWAISLKNAGSSDIGPWVQASAFYGAGPQCLGVTSPSYTGPQQSLGLDSGGQLPPGGTVTVDGYLILQGIVTPAHPNGDPAVFRDLSLGLDQTQVIDSTSSNWVDGPISVGVVQVADTAKRIPLSVLAP